MDTPDTPDTRAAALAVAVDAGRLAEALAGEPGAFARVLIEAALIDRACRGGLGRALAAELAARADRPGAALPLAGFLAAIGGAP